MVPLGPDCLLGYGYVDTLSFELSPNGQRVLVSAGIFKYDRGVEYQWEHDILMYHAVVVMVRVCQRSGATFVALACRAHSVCEQATTLSQAGWRSNMTVIFIYLAGWFTIVSGLHENAT